MPRPSLSADSHVRLPYRPAHAVSPLTGQEFATPSDAAGPGSSGETYTFQQPPSPCEDGSALIFDILYDAISDGDGPKLSDLLGLNPQIINAADPDGYTLLHHAILLSNTAAVRELLSRGADPHALAPDDWTPLHLAGSRAVARELLRCGAGPSRRNADGNTPLHVFLRSPGWWADPARSALVDAVMGQHAALDAANARGETPFHLAVDSFHPPFHARRRSGRGIPGRHRAEPLRLGSSGICVSSSPGPRRCATTTGESRAHRWRRRRRSTGARQGGSKGGGPSSWMTRRKYRVLSVFSGKRAVVERYVGLGRAGFGRGRVTP